MPGAGENSLSITRGGGNQREGGGASKTGGCVHWEDRASCQQQVGTAASPARGGGKGEGGWLAKGVSLMRDIGIQGASSYPDILGCLV